jgi:outer membrane lipoprotein LolB
VNPARRHTHPASARPSLWCLILLALLLVLSGCASPVRTTHSDGSSWQGRMVVQVESEPPQAYTGGFELIGSAAQGQLRLISPLGQAVAEVQWDPQGAELRRGQQVTRRGSLDELTLELAGTALPVAALFDWLAGREAPAEGWQADLSRHAEGRIAARRQLPPPVTHLRLVFLP